MLLWMAIVGVLYLNGTLNKWIPVHVVCVCVCVGGGGGGGGGGGCFNIKIMCYKYRNSPYKEGTIVGCIVFMIGISLPEKMVIALEPGLVYF